MFLIKKLKASALVSVFVTALLCTTASAFSFSDLNNHPYSESIKLLTEKEIIQGYEDGTFKPYNLVTRAELLKIVFKTHVTTDGKSLEIGTDNKDCFPDTNGHWAENFICYAQQRNIVKGDGTDGLFHPDRPVSLVEAAKIIYLENYYGYGDINYQSIKFSESLDTWYRAYLTSLTSYIPPEINTISKQLTRAEVVEILYRQIYAERDSLYTQKFSYFDEKDQHYVLEWFADGYYGYYRSSKEIFLRRKPQDISVQPYYLISNDAENFRKLDPNCTESCFWRDSFDVFYEYRGPIGADPDTFERFEAADDSDHQVQYYRDKNFIFLNAGGPVGFVKIEADFDTFKGIDAYFAKDKNKLYDVSEYEKPSPPPADPATFRVGNSERGIYFDKDSIFIIPNNETSGSFQEIPWTDASKLKVPEPYDLYRVDVDHVMFGPEDAYIDIDYIKDDVNSYLILASGFFDGKGNLWREALQSNVGDLKFERFGEELAILTVPNPNDETIYFLGKHHFKVGDRAYYLNHQIKGANVASFEVYNSDEEQIEHTTSSLGWAQVFSHDMVNLYNRGSKIEGADPNTLEEVSGWYYKDKNQVYNFDGEIVSNKPDEFILLDNNLKATDGDYLYLYGHRIEGADITSLQRVSYSNSYQNCYLDAKNNYFLEEEGVYSGDLILTPKDEWLAAGCKEPTN